VACYRVNFPLLLLYHYNHVLFFNPDFIVIFEKILFIIEVRIIQNRYLYKIQLEIRLLQVEFLCNIEIQQIRKYKIKITFMFMPCILNNKSFIIYQHIHIYCL
jgi:hypothetical protein